MTSGHGRDVMARAASVPPEIKVALVGDKHVGKSSLIRRYVHDDFSLHYFHTYGGEGYKKIVKVNNTTFRLKLMDAAGHDFSRPEIKPLYRDAHGIIIVFDITRPDTLGAVSEWLKDIGEENLSNPVVYMVGNKTDLRSFRKVKPENARLISHDLGLPYYETSAKNGHNVKETFLALIRDITLTLNYKSETQGLLMSTEAASHLQDICCAIL